MASLTSPGANQQHLPSSLRASTRPHLGVCDPLKKSHNLWVWLALSLILRDKDACLVQAHEPLGSGLEGKREHWGQEATM